MESRKNIITTSGEGHVLSPRDRKAVNGMGMFMELTEDSSSISFPLRNLIPEITDEGNLLSSFNRVIRNLRQSSSDREKKNCVIIDGREYTHRQARFVRQKSAIISQLKQGIGNP